MPVNLELKAGIASIAAARKTALDAGGEFRGTMRQTDTYFVVAHGRLKLREIEGGEAELISYDRPESDQTRWSRFVKTPVPDPAVMREMLSAALGVLATVRKTRDLFILDGSRIHLDSVESLGTFLEFEVPAGADNAEEARVAMDALRKTFAIRDCDVFLHSYSDLILSRNASLSPGAHP